MGYKLLLNTLLYKTSAQTLWSKQYTWYPNGMNLKTLTDALNSANTMSYTYDPDNRIATAAGAGVSETYTPDPWGNLKQSGNFSFQQSFNSSNQISTGGYSYDQAGDLTTDGGGTTYSYDADGMITASGGVTYDYDALDQRMDVFGGSHPGETIYFAGAPIALHDPSSGDYTNLIYANGQMIAEVGTQTTYRAEDHLGSLALQTNGSGTVTGSNTFLPFGQFLNSTTSDEFQFTELPQDTENSSYHAGFRNFSYEQGRWLSPDPYNGSYDLTNPQSFNRYAYVNNNSLGFIDPSGLYVVVGCWVCWGGGVPNQGGGGGDGEFTSYNVVDGGIGPQYIPSDYWDAMMQDGYGGNVTDGPNGSLMEQMSEVENGQTVLVGKPVNVGYTWMVGMYQVNSAAYSPTQNASLVNNLIYTTSSSNPPPPPGSEISDLEQRAIRFACKSSPDNKVLSSMELGFVTGALKGGIAGGAGGAFFEGVGAVPGAIIGGFIGGVAGSAAGVLKGTAIASICSLAGAY